MFGSLDRERESGTSHVESLGLPSVQIDDKFMHVQYDSVFNIMPAECYNRAIISIHKTEVLL